MTVTEEQTAMEGSVHPSALKHAAISQHRKEREFADYSNSDVDWTCMVGKVIYFQGSDSLWSLFSHLCPRENKNGCLSTHPPYLNTCTSCLFHKHRCEGCHPGSHKSFTAQQGTKWHRISNYQNELEGWKGDMRSKRNIFK